MSTVPSSNGKGPVIFVGTYTEPQQSTSEGVYVFGMDPASGKLTLRNVIKNLTNPSFLAVHPQTGNLYIYRDPRDAMLSAMDHGKSAMLKGRPNAFSYLGDFEQAVDFMTTYVRIWQAWVRERGVLVSRYEDLLQDYDVEARRLAAFLGIEVTKPEIGDVLGRFRPEHAEGRQGTHFFKGRVGRFREAFSTAQQATLAVKFGPYLEKMGYPI